ASWQDCGSNSGTLPGTLALGRELSRRFDPEPLGARAESFCPNLLQASVTSPARRYPGRHSAAVLNPAAACSDSVRPVDCCRLWVAHHREARRSVGRLWADSSFPAP